MKVLYVTTISSTVNAFLVPHIKLLIEEGYEVGVAFNIVHEVTPELLQLGCKIHQIDFQRNPLKGENFAAYRQIKKTIIDEKYEFIHVHTPVASFLTRMACRNIEGVKVFYTAHGFHFFKGAPTKNWILYYTFERFVARWTDGIITMNDEDYNAAKKFRLRKDGLIYKIHGVGLDLTKFLPQCLVKKARLRKEYKYDINDFILIYVGELSYRKHQDMLIEAVGRFKGNIPNLKLLLVGDGSLLTEYKELVSRIGMEDQIELLGYRKDIENLMAISDLAISTSRQEGLPVNIMEAMATGLPVIVTDCRGNRDLVSDGENGFVVGSNDVDACADAIMKLYNSKDLRQRFGKHSRELVLDYSQEQVMKEMKDIYTTAFNG